MSELDRVRLQEALDALNKWSDTWGMQFNVPKCKVMHLGHRAPITSWMVKRASCREVIIAIRF